MPLSLSPEKTALAASVAAALRPGQRVCLTTHVNPDGDGLGSEVGLVHLLRAQGIDAIITNPSPLHRASGSCSAICPASTRRPRPSGSSAGPT